MIIAGSEPSTQLHYPAMPHPAMKKAPLAKNKGALIMVAWGGIEPPTQGFSVLCSTD